jgi:hypothetical protein
MVIHTRVVTRYSVARKSNPEGWLAVAIVADVGAYWAASQVSGLLFWLALDLWLTYRIWRGGATALMWFRFLQLLGVVLHGSVLLFSQWEDSIDTGANPGTVVLLAISLWCLMAPALSQHVNRLPSDQSAPAVAEHS